MADTAVEACVIPTEGEWVKCSCCGEYVPDTPEANVHYGQVPYPDDIGFGLCRRCGGDSTVEVKDPRDEAAIKRRLGWAATTFYEARFDTIRNALNEKNRAKWDGCSYTMKVQMVIKAVENGWII